MTPLITLTANHHVKDENDSFLFKSGGFGKQSKTIFLLNNRFLFYYFFLQQQYIVQSVVFYTVTLTHLQ